MNPIQWLSANAPGFNELSEDDRQAILHFSFLWSLFEAKALNSRASPTAICALVNRWVDQHRLDAVVFRQSLDYFKDRYFHNGTATEHFRGLNLRQNDKRALV